MTDVCFVFASTAEQSPEKMINRYLKNVEFDVHYLCSTPKEKILKKDVDFDLKKLEDYRIVCLVGAEALKYAAGMTGVQKYNGVYIEKKYLPIMHPNIIQIKPQLDDEIKKAFAKIPLILAGKDINMANDKDYCFIETEEDFQKYKRQVELANPIVVDIETTSVTPRTGTILGIAVSTKPHQGLYYSRAIVDKHSDWFKAQFKSKKCIFHNAKFDMGYMAYELDYYFPDFEDTMLLHYTLEEAVGTHGLKPLAMRFTDLGDYERDLDEYKKSWARKNKVKLADFNYGMLPDDILAPYACLTHDSKVVMADGSKKTIGELVRNKSKELVRSYNHKSNTWENKPINGWYKLADKKVSWFKLVTSTTNKNSRWDTYNGPVFTHDHKVSTNNGYKEIQHLDITVDKIQVDDHSLNYDQTQVLLGSLMGDGTLNSRWYSGAGFEFTQSNKRVKYFNLKKHLFSKYISNIVTNTKTNTSTFYTNYTEQFSDFNKSIVWRPTSQDKKPFLSLDFLAKIDWLGLATWYFDDGNNADNYNYNMGKRIRIWSRTVSVEEQQNVISILKNKFGIEAEYYDDGNNQFFVLKNYDKFFKHIAKFATEDLAYKLPEKYRKLINTYDYNYKQSDPYFTKIHKIVGWQAPASRKGYKTKWCIDVQDNHNFLTDVGLVHNCKDGDATFQLFAKFYDLVMNNEKFSKLYTNILKEGTIALMKLESNGGPINKSQVEWLAEQYQIDVEECVEEISAHPAVKQYERIHGKSFNPNSTLQLREVFFNIMSIKPVKKTATGAWSVDKEVLKEMANPLSEAVLDLREKSKMAGTYINNIRKGIDHDGRLRSGFNIHGTTSGRLSSSGTLNYQNIPRDNKDIKKLFKARPGYKIVQCDLGTAEVYYAAKLSGDTFLMQAFIDKLDFHSYVAKQMFNLKCTVAEIKNLFPAQRQYAKAITFGIMYQAGPAKIAETVNKDAKPGEEITIAQAKQFISKYFSEAKALKRFIDSSNKQIENHAFIYAFFGRKRRLPEAKAPNPGVAKHAIRSGVNFLVQSVASDINILGLIDLMKWVEEKQYEEYVIPFTVVHDSIVSEVKEEYIEEYIRNTKECIQRDRGLSIEGCPIKVDFEIGDSWGDLHDLKDLQDEGKYTKV